MTLLSYFFWNARTCYQTHITGLRTWLYIRAYDSLFAGTGKLCKDEGLYINREDFGNGYALYAFDLTADLGKDDHFSLVRQGSVRLALKFAAALDATITVVAYAEFENIIEVDRDRNVVFDFGV